MWDNERFSSLFAKISEKRRANFCAIRCYRHSPVAEFMIKNGADVNIPGIHNLTPFHMAIKNEEG